MEGMVVFVDVALIIRDKLVPSVIFLLLVSVVELIKYLVALRPVLSALGIEPADSDMIPVFDASLLGSVELLGVFLL